MFILSHLNYESGRRKDQGERGALRKAKISLVKVVVRKV